jgi:arylsulfatase A-like enzyme
VSAHEATVSGSHPHTPIKRLAALIVAAVTGAVPIVIAVAIGREPLPDSGPAPGTGGTVQAPPPQIDETPPVRPPNVVLIITDDQRADAMQVMPAVERLIGDRGVRFSNAVVSNPFCCPSRATILTGLYSHRTGVYGNGGSTGGWPTFAANGAETATIATALDAARYRTGLFGKYLNDYDSAPAGYVPPGWDRWFTFVGENGAYFNYTMFDDQRGVRRYGADPADYSTDVIAAEAERFIRTTPAAQPFLLMVTPYAGHDPWTPAPRHEHDFDGAPVDLGPAFGEDVSDKPPYIRERHPSSRWEMRERTRAAWETLRSVDEMVERLFRTLAETGRVRSTLFVFMSDHGLSSGQHRWQHKLTPYEESIHIPMLVRYDDGGISQGVTADGLVANVDVAPTILEFTGASLPGVEGLSLRPLLVGAQTKVRDMVLLEHAGVDGEIVPPYCGLRTPRFTYARYADGFEELYDLANDPSQLENLASAAAYADTVARLDAALRARCAPTPPGFAFPGP